MQSTQQASKINNYDGSIPQNIEFERIADCFHDNGYDFRTVKGIANDKKIDEFTVQSILENKQFRKSLVTDQNGDTLYTLRKKSIKPQEYLALIQTYLAFPFKS